MEKHQFEPFDQVLVRDSNTELWKCELFSHYSNDPMLPYVCTGSLYSQCILYNEKTKCLLGTTKLFPPRPKTYHVEWGSSQIEQQDYTDEEFENFIKTAVLRNKDISNFKVTRICG